MDQLVYHYSLLRREWETCRNFIDQELLKRNKIDFPNGGTSQTVIDKHMVNINDPPNSKPIFPHVNLNERIMVTVNGKTFSTNNNNRHFFL